MKIKEVGSHFLVTYDVLTSDPKLRLDAFLKSRYRKRSRESIQRAIQEGQVHIIRKHAESFQPLGKIKPSSLLLKGDEVHVLTERKPEPQVSFDYRILYEDEAIVVIDKPPNLPVHPAGRYFMNTLLIHLRTEAHTLPLHADREYFLAHRIDKETSGVLVLAKNKEMCARLTAQFANRTTEKTYHAIVQGLTPSEHFSNHTFLRRDPHSRLELKMATCSETDEGALHAETTFKTLGHYRNRTGQFFSWVECFPKTGRQHQIRVHLAHLGHPIVGDKVYSLPEEEAEIYVNRKTLTAEAEARLILPRQALHAAQLTLTHPETQKRMAFASPLPQDLDCFLKTLTPCRTPTRDSLGTRRIGLNQEL